MRIELAADEQLTVAAQNDSYQFSLNAHAFSDTGLTDSINFTGINSSALTLTNLSVFSTIQVVDTAHGASVNFVDGNAQYHHEFSVQLDNASTVSFAGSSSFGNNDLNVTTNGGIVISGVVSTIGGDINLTASNESLIAAPRHGVRLSGGHVITFGTGDITMTGTGGTLSLFNHAGILLEDNSSVQSTSTVADAGTISIDGNGGTGNGANHGVEINQSDIDSAVGAISVVGVGGSGDESGNHGVRIVNTSNIRSTSISPNAATITITGTGGTGVSDNAGFHADGNSRIHSANGDIGIAGTGGNGTGDGNRGIHVTNGAIVDSTGQTADAADVTLTGTGGTGVNQNTGVALISSDSDRAEVRSVAGDIVVTGQGGITSGTNNHGIYVEDAGIESRGLDDFAGEISLRGTGGGGTTENNGLHAVSNSHLNPAIRTVLADVTIEGEATPATLRGYGVYIFGQGETVSSSSSALTGSDIQIIGTSQAEGGAGIHLSAEIATKAASLSMTGLGPIGISLNGQVSSNAGQVEFSGHGRTYGGINASVDLRNDGGETRISATTNSNETTAISFFNRMSYSTAGDHVVSLSAPSITIGTSQISTPNPFRVSTPLDAPIRLTTNFNANLKAFDFVDDVSVHGETVLGVGFGEGGATEIAELLSRGSVDIQPSATFEPRWAPGWQPVDNQEYVIVDRNGGNGMFAGLPENAVLPDFFNARISYVGGDGDDISITLPSGVSTPATLDIEDLGDLGTRFRGDDHSETGQSVSKAGDVNGDGYDDVLISAPSYPHFPEERRGSGTVYLIYGGPDLPQDTSYANIDTIGVEIQGAYANAFLGRNLNSADFNGDGYSDLLMLSNRSSPDLPRSAGHIVWGGPSLPNRIDLRTFAGQSKLLFPDNDCFDSQITGVNDVNGDGFHDVAISIACRFVDADSSVVYLLPGGAETPAMIDLTVDTTPKTVIRGPGYVGTTLAALGDVDADGFADFGIGSESLNPNTGGKAYVIRGSDSLPDQIDLSVENAPLFTVVSTAHFSAEVGGGGDINGDGADDVLVSSIAYRDDRQRSVDETYVVFGAPNLSSGVSLTLEDERVSRIRSADILGTAFEGAFTILSDVDGDGFDDIGIGSPYADGAFESLPGSGRIHVLRGNEEFPPEIDLSVPGTSDLVLFGRYETAGTGRAISGAGDFNGDGFGDLLIGAHSAGDFAENIVTTWGEAYIVSGTILVPEIPAVVSPVGTTTTSRPTLNWSPARDVVSYEVWLELIGGDSNPIANPTVAETSYALTQDLTIGRYRTWVRAKRSDDTYSAWTSQVFSVTDETQLDAIPFHVETSRPTLAWNPVPGAVGYRITVSNLTQGTPGVVDEIVSGTSFSPEVDLRFGRHRAWVQPIGPGDYRGTWSSSLDFQIGPTLLSPGASSLDGDVVFEWTRPAEAATFELYLLRRGGTAEVYSGLTAATFSPAEPLLDGDYLWWIRGAAANGLKGAWSPRGEFNIGGRAEITSPHGTEVTGIPVIEWEDVKGAASYEVYLYNDDTQELTLRKSGIETNSLATLPLRQGNYRVWVRSYRHGGTPGQWSRPHSFQYQAAALATVAARATQVVTFDDRPPLSWQSSGQVNSFNLYATDGTTVIFETDIQSEEWIPPNPLAPTKWTWWVQAVDSSGALGPWSNSATIDTSGRPVVTAPSSPANGLRPTFEWTGVVGGERYVLFVENLTLGEAVFREDELAENRFTPQQTFAAGMYRVWVQAISSAGDRGPWSLRHDFEVA